jgi:hypothetical protein
MNTTHVIIGGVLAVALVAGGIYINGFKNWLVWAVSEAENMFGSKTGQLKLRYVYELAVQRFPTIAKFIPFETFGKMVDGALDIMRKMIENNEDIANIIVKQ